MGALRDDNGKLKPLTRDEEMVLVGGALIHRPANGDLVTFLENNPDEAFEMGRIVERMGRELKEAFPGETRVRTYSNEDWTAAGYSHVAEMNELLGLKGR